jgi:hypothetical protein
LKGLWNIGVAHCGELRGSVPNRLITTGASLPCPCKQRNALTLTPCYVNPGRTPRDPIGTGAARHVGFASEGTSFGENQCRNIPSDLGAWLVVLISARSKTLALCILLAYDPQYPTLCGSLNWSSFTSSNP